MTQRIPANARGRHDGGIVFGGVGFGILVSGAIVLAAGSFADWRQLWLICAAISAVFTIIAWTWPIPSRIPVEKAQAETAQARTEAASGPATEADTAFDANRRRSMLVISAGYFFQGGGYIIIGTYLVVLAGPVFGDTAAASTWLVAGLATAPSPLLWSFVAGRIGTVRTLTVWYSIGQIAGPALVAAALSENIVAAFIASAIALAIAMVLTLAGTLTGNIDR